MEYVYTMSMEQLGGNEMTTPISELSLMSETEKLYRMYERLEEMYLANGDWKKALEMKWGMLKHTGGN